MRGGLRCGALVAASVAWLGCGDDPVSAGPTLLVAVTPGAAASDVGLEPVIELRFDGVLDATGGWPVALQLGDCPGPVVMGTWSRSEDGQTLSFEPAMPLTASTPYTVHVGGRVLDAAGAPVDLETRGPGLGGTWVTPEMVMGTGMMGTGMPSHSGPEWRDSRGTFGLAFSFETGS